MLSLFRIRGWTFVFTNILFHSASFSKFNSSLNVVLLRFFPSSLLFVFRGVSSFLPFLLRAFSAIFVSFLFI